MPLFTRPVLMSTSLSVFAPLSVRPGRAGFAVVATLSIFASAAVTTWLFVPRAGGMDLAEPPQPAVAAGETLNAVLSSAATYVNQKEPEKAEAIMREAIARFPEERELRTQYAQVLLALKRSAEAYEQYAVALKLGPKDAGLEFMAGAIGSPVGRPPAAGAP